MGLGGGGGASVTVGRANADSRYVSVVEQSGIKAGDGGYQVNVGGGTTLVGGVIGSSQTAHDAGRNVLTTTELVQTDIANSARYEASAVTLGGGVGSMTGAAGGVGKAEGSSESVTRSGVDVVIGKDGGKDSVKHSASALTPIFDANKTEAVVRAQATVLAAFSSVAPREIANYAQTQITTLRASGSPESEVAKWEEGGQYRVALHSVAGGLTGGAAGMAGAATSASAAPLMTQFQEGLKTTLIERGMSEGLASQTAQAVALVTAVGTGAAVGGVRGGLAGVVVDANNRQLHPDERAWASDNAKKYVQYLKDITGETIPPEEAYQRLLSASYAIVDFAAEKSGKSDETAKQFIATNKTGDLFKATAAERANPFLNGNKDGSWTAEQQARFGTKTPGEIAKKLVAVTCPGILRPRII